MRPPVALKLKKKSAVPEGRAPALLPKRNVLLRSVRRRPDVSGSHDECAPRVEILLADEHLEPVLARRLLVPEDGGVLGAPIGELLGAGEHRTHRASAATGFPELVARTRRRLVLLPLFVEFPNRLVRMRQGPLTIAHRALAEDAEPLGAGFDQDVLVDGVVDIETASMLECIHLFGGRDVAVLTALPTFALIPGVSEFHESTLIHECLHFVLRDLVVPGTTPIIEAVEVVGDLLGRGVVAASVTEVAGERAGVGIDVPFPDPVEGRREIKRHSLQCSVSHRTSPFVRGFLFEMCCFRAIMPDC